MRISNLITTALVCISSTAASESIKETTEALCSSCHSFSTVERSHGFNNSQWHRLIGGMVDFTGQQQLQSEIADYLSKRIPIKADSSVVVKGPLSLHATVLPVVTKGQRPRDPIYDHNGNIWWVGQRSNQMGRMNARTGEVKEYMLPEGTYAHSVSIDANGNPWFLGNKNGTIGWLDQSTDQITAIKLPRDDARDPHTGVFDSDGRLWFTMQHSNLVGRYDPSDESFQIVEMPREQSRPYGIKLDGLGNAYVSCNGSNCLVKFDESLTPTLIEIPHKDSHSRRLAIAPDGRVFYVNSGRGRLGVYDPKDGSIKEWATPSGEKSHPYAIEYADNAIWFNESRVRPETLVRFDLQDESMQSWAIQSKGLRAGIIRHMRRSPNGIIAHQGANNTLVEFSWSMGENKQRAQELAKSLIIADTHVDVPYRLIEHYEDVGHATHSGDFDYPRAVNGGLNAPFMSIYIPAALEAEGKATQKADELIDLVEKIVAEAPDKFAIATSWQQIEEQFKRGLISLPLGMENGAPIAGDLDNLTHFYNRGIRYITLTHSLSNHIADSSYDENRPAGGLTDFGKQLIVEMNNKGMMIDVSHVSDDAFWDTIKITKVPVIASHSSARAFTPGFERNMSDEMIEALGKQGGVIFINFSSLFVKKASLDSWPDIEKGEFVYADISDVLDHIDHVKRLAGIDAIGIGSDFDGVGDTLPNGLKDVSAYPTLIEGLLDRGYTEAEIEKITWGNLKRVWQQVDNYAAGH